MTKMWVIRYRPFYNQWVTLLKTIDPLIYAPIPSLVIPKRILAQYETEVSNKLSLLTSNFDKSPTTVRNIPKPQFSPLNKLEVLRD